MSVSIYYQNTRGLRSKTHEFYNSASDCSFEIIVITESWLDSSIDDLEILPSSFNVLRSDRDFGLTGRRTGGGVLIGLSDAFKYEIIDTSTFRDLVPLVDIVLCKLLFKPAPFYVAAVYIPPDISRQQFEEFFDYLGILVLDKPFIILGDFNLPNYVSDPLGCAKCNYFQSFLSMHHFHQFNTVTNCNGRLLDLVLSNLKSDVGVSADDLPFVAIDPHHPPLAVSLDLHGHGSNTSAFPSNDNIRYNFRRADFTALYSELGGVDWSTLEAFNDVDAALQHFYSILYQACDEYVPKSKIRACRSTYPGWFSSEIVSCLKLKSYYRRRWRSTHNPFYLSEFRRLRCYAKTLISQAYHNYLSDVETIIQNDPKQIFQFVRNRRGSSRIPHIMYYNDIVLDTPTAIVDALAHKFRSSYHVNVAATTDDSWHNCLPFSLQTASEEDLISIMASFSADFNSGDDMIPGSLIKDGRFLLAKPLAIIINLSILTSTFPKIWRRSRLIPVFKKGDRAQVLNYRPISILSNFAKVFESYIYSCLYSNVKSLISSNQHGFYRGRSTVTNLVSLTQFISQELDARGQVDVVYTDFTSAFDTIDHNLLLLKLSSVGSSPALLRLLESYLRDRKCYVSYNGFDSAEFTSTSGVPQGSNLGPLLFIIFINDLLRSFTCPVLAYADDLKIYARIDSWTDVTMLQANLNMMVDWCSKFNLTLNNKKCFYVNYTRKKLYVESSYAIDGCVLERLEQITDLGVTFDSQLTFSTHVSNVTISASKALGFVMRSCKHFTNVLLFKTLYFSFVSSKLEYASAVWSPHYIYLQLSVEKVQRRFLKFLSYRIDGYYPARNTEYMYLLERHGFQSLACRREIHGARFIAKLVNGRIDAPSLLSGLNFHVPRISARYGSTFLLPTPNTELFRGSPMLMMCRAANFHYEDIFFGSNT